MTRDTVTAIQYTVPGRPVTWARSAYVAGRVTTPKAQRAAKKSHQIHAIAAGFRRHGWSLDGAFSVEVRSYYASAVTGDVDRAAGIALDALEGIAYRVDRQVRTLVSSVIADGSPERVVVVVTRFAVDPVVPRVRRVAARAKRVMR